MRVTYVYAIEAVGRVCVCPVERGCMGAECEWWHRGKPVVQHIDFIYVFYVTCIHLQATRVNDMDSRWYMLVAQSTIATSYTLADACECVCVCSVELPRTTFSMKPKYTQFYACICLSILIFRVLFSLLKGNEGRKKSSTFRHFHLVCVERRKKKNSMNLGSEQN